MHHGQTQHTDTAWSGGGRTDIGQILAMDGRPATVGAVTGPVTAPVAGPVSGSVGGSVGGFGSGFGSAFGGWAQAQPQTQPQAQPQAQPAAGVMDVLREAMPGLDDEAIKAMVTDELGLVVDDDDDDDADDEPVGMDDDEPVGMTGDDDEDKPASMTDTDDDEPVGMTGDDEPVGMTGDDDEDAAVPPNVPPNVEAAAQIIERYAEALTSVGINGAVAASVAQRAVAGRMDAPAALRLAIAEQTAGVAAGHGAGRRQHAPGGQHTNSVTPAGVIAGYDPVAALGGPPPAIASAALPGKGLATGYAPPARGTTKNARAAAAAEVAKRAQAIATAQNTDLASARLAVKREDPGLYARAYARG